MFIGTISCADDVYAARSNKETILNITVGKSFTEKKTYKGIVKVKNSYITIKKTKSRIYVTYSVGHNYDHLGINEKITSNDSNSTYAKYTERTKGHGTNSISIKRVYKKVK